MSAERPVKFDDDAFKSLVESEVHKVKCIEMIKVWVHLAQLRQPT